MKKYRFLYALCLPIMILGCTDDSDSIPSPTAEFVSIGTGFREADGPRSVVLPLRNFNSSPFTLADVLIKGSATRGDDYDVVGITEEGIQINLKDDDLPEYVETIEVIIPGTAGNLIHTVTLASNDPGFVDINLLWETDADMDLYLLYQESPDADFEVVSSSDPGHVSLDFKAPDGLYGLSYNYYDGTDDPLDFTATFTTTRMPLNGSFAPLSYKGTYTLENIASEVLVEQTFVKKGIALSEFTNITVPKEGSRMNNDLAVKMRKAIADYKAIHH